MTLATKIAVYETAFVGYTVIGVGVAVFLYLWFRSTLAASPYFQNLIKTSVARRARVQGAILMMAAALGAGWFIGIFAVLLARAVSGWSYDSLDEDEGEETGLQDDLERVRALVANDDAASGILVAVVMAIRTSGPTLTRSVIEKILEHWGAFLPEARLEVAVPAERPKIDAEFEDDP